MSLMSRLDDMVRDWGDYVFIEVHGARYSEEDYSTVLLDDEDPKWYSVYLVHNDGCSLCIGDHTTYSEALEHSINTKLEHKHLKVGVNTLKQLTY